MEVYVLSVSDHVTFYQVEILSTAYIFNIFLRFKCYFVDNFRISFMSKVL